MTMRPLALPLLFIPGAAAADVTPQDVWDNMLAGYGAVGVEVTATLEGGGDTLIVNDAKGVLTYPIIGGQVSVTFPPMTLIGQGDGTVKIDTPSTYVVSALADIPDEDDQLSVEVTIATDGFNSVASGDPGDVLYTSTATNFDMLVSNLVIPDMDVGAFDIQFDSDGYDNETRVTDAGTVTITNTAVNRASVTTMNFDAEEFRQEGTTNTGVLTTALALVIPPEVDIMNLSAALRAGMSLSVDATSEGGSSQTITYMDGEVFSDQSQTSGANETTLGFDADGIRLAGSGESGTFSMSGQDVMLPFPIEATFGAASINFAFPLLASQSAQAFAYGFSLNDVAVNDDIWNLIDAGQALDRAPVDLTLDLAGDITNTADLLDPATWEAIDQGVIPVAPNSLSLNELAIGVLGAALNASGAFTFDNNDLETFGGVPRPEGKITASATGLNAAIDQLVAAGLIGEQDVQMPRMFMGMFAVADGNDSLTTALEINAQGHVIVNGQRIQ